MGCDGGTIPKRNEIVKNKQKDQGRDKDAELAAKWHYCALSSLPLVKPIVACPLGRLYNKIAIVEYLLDSQSKQQHPNATLVSHIKSLRDVRELKLVEKRKTTDKNHQPSTTNASEQIETHFMCPISGLDFNGKYKFYYLFQCGCVFSERAHKQVPNDKQCLLCSKPYDPELDLIVLNGNESETDALRDRLEKLAKRKQQSKRSHKTSTSGTCNSSNSSKFCHTESSHRSEEDIKYLKKRRKESSVAS